MVRKGGICCFVVGVVDNVVVWFIDYGVVVSR